MTRHVPPGGGAATPRQGQGQIPVARAIGGPERTDTTRRVLPGGGAVTPGRGQRQIPVAGATGGPKKNDMMTHRTKEKLLPLGWQVGPDRHI